MGNNGAMGGSALLNRVVTDSMHVLKQRACFEYVALHCMVILHILIQ